MDEDDDGWQPWTRWHTPVGTVDLWKRRDQLFYVSPVRVTGDVPHAIAHDLWNLGQKAPWLTAVVGSKRKRCSSAEAEVDGRRVVFQMPHRGFFRSTRRILVRIDEDEYVARARSFGSVQLERANGVPVWRTRCFGSDQVADDISSRELAVAALMAAAELERQMVHEFWSSL